MKILKFIYVIITLPLRIGRYLLYLILFSILFFLLFSCNTDNSDPPNGDGSFRKEKKYNLPYSFEENNFNFPSTLEVQLAGKDITEINLNQSFSNRTIVQTNNILANDLSYNILNEIITDIVEHYPLFQSTNLEISITRDSKTFIQQDGSKVSISSRLKELCQTREEMYFLISHILARSILKKEIPPNDLGFMADLMALEVLNYLQQCNAITALDVYRNILYKDTNNQLTKSWLRYHPQTMLEPQLTSLLLNFKNS